MIARSVARDAVPVTLPVKLPEKPPVDVVTPVTNESPTTWSLEVGLSVEIPILPAESITNLFAELVVSFTTKVPLRFCKAKSELLLVSTKNSCGKAFSIVIFVLAVIFPVATILPEIDTPPEYVCNFTFPE